MILGKHTTKFFPIASGFKQGDSLSAVPFNLAQHNAMHVILNICDNGV